MRLVIKPTKKTIEPMTSCICYWNPSGKYGGEPSCPSKRLCKPSKPGAIQSAVTRDKS